MWHRIKHLWRRKKWFKKEKKRKKLMLSASRKTRIGHLLRPFEFNDTRIKSSGLGSGALQNWAYLCSVCWIVWGPHRDGGNNTKEEEPDETVRHYPVQGKLPRRLPAGLNAHYCYQYSHIRQPPLVQRAVEMAWLRRLNGRLWGYKAPVGCRHRPQVLEMTARYRGTKNEVDRGERSEIWL